MFAPQHNVRNCATVSEGAHAPWVCNGGDEESLHGSAANVQLTSLNVSYTCRFRMRSCALGAARSRLSPTARFSKPAIPAAGSAWPTLALTPLSTIDRVALLDLATSAATNELDSIGSPKAVPVPCASCNVIDSDETLALISPAVRRLDCASPLGAVRLADRPSCRTALPSRRPFARCWRPERSMSAPASLASSIPVGTSIECVRAAALRRHSSDCKRRCRKRSEHEHRADC